MAIDKNRSESRESAYPWMKVHDLDEEHQIFTGNLPNELVLNNEQFETLWQLHPIEYQEIQLHGRLVKTPRWQQAYGNDYRFSGQTSRALPVPPILQPFRQWCCARIDRRLNGLLLNWHDGSLGHYHGPHRDSRIGLVVGTPIVTISLGEDRIFRLRPWKKKGFIDFEPKNGSVYLLPFSTNLTWTHEIPRKASQLGRRISVTLRAFSQE